MDKLEVLRLVEAKRRIQAVDEFEWYCKLHEFVPADHHRLLIGELEKVEMGFTDILLVMMPPGSAKSTYSSVLFPAWYLGRNPHKCVIAASHTGELAERFGRRVRNTVAGEEHQKIFPDSKLSPDSAAAGRWELTKGGEYFAAGVGGSITGRRADLAIIDDPVKSREDADSETIREKQWAWWRDDLQTRLKPNAGIVLIMTRWHEDDLAGRLLEDLKGTSQRVVVLKLPMEAGEDDPLGRMPGQLLWPEWFTPQMVEVAKREPRTWTSLYQQEPRPLGGGEFKLEWLTYYRKAPAVGQKVILVDPSSGKSKTRGDYTSMWVVGVGADGNDYVIDGVRDRLNLTERCEKLFELVRRYKPAAVGYEQYGLQADIEYIRIEQERQQYRFRVIELGGSLKKEDRIRRLIPGMQSGRLWLPEALNRVQTTGETRDLIQDLKDEMLSFPVGAHDDAIDCLARKEEPEIRRLLLAPRQDERRVMGVEFQAYDSGVGY